MITLDAAAHLRRATLADLDAIVAIKRGLPMPQVAQTSTGGFLLGSEAERYRALLGRGRVWLLEVDGRPAGFTVTLDDAALRGSPLWARREAIRWAPEFDASAALDLRVAYFDQLAVLASVRRRYWGAALALRALTELFDDEGHGLVLTTTVVEPVRNRAALPHLARIGARACGTLDERYPEVGRVVSAVHGITLADYRRARAALAARGPATRTIVGLVGGAVGPAGAPGAPGAR